MLSGKFGVVVLCVHGAQGGCLVVWLFVAVGLVVWETDIFFVGFLLCGQLTQINFQFLFYIRGDTTLEL